MAAVKSIHKFWLQLHSRRGFIQSVCLGTIEVLKKELIDFALFDKALVRHGKIAVVGTEEAG